jgi:hypothetical protein
MKCTGARIRVRECGPASVQVHDAIMREPNEDVPDGTVLQEFRKGFAIGDKLLRPAMVKVCGADGVHVGEGYVEVGHAFMERAWQRRQSLRVAAPQKVMCMGGEGSDDSHGSGVVMVQVSFSDMPMAPPAETSESESMASAESDSSD